MKRIVDVGSRLRKRLNPHWTSLIDEGAKQEEAKADVKVEKEAMEGKVEKQDVESLPYEAPADAIVSVVTPTEPLVAEPAADASDMMETDAVSEPSVVTPCADSEAASKNSPIVSEVVGKQPVVEESAADEKPVSEHDAVEQADVNEGLANTSVVKAAPVEPTPDATAGANTC
ncbi:hypothetical protein PENSPDRAFT_689461 [Peniophora sp. CONT]|nr:hypothetical protein PENSPDRAFT_689461 [Peniophora sp. CONT]